MGNSIDFNGGIYRAAVHPDGKLEAETIIRYRVSDRLGEERVRVDRQRVPLQNREKKKLRKSGFGGGEKLSKNVRKG